MDTTHRIRAHFADSAQLKLAAVDVMAPHIARAASLITDCLLADGKILACGNGGSAADAQHFAAEMVGRFERERPELPAISLVTDTSILTAIANDIGTEAIFLRQVIAYGREGDAAIAISTSGNSVNLIEALTEARRRELVTLAFVGYDGGRIASEGLTDHVIVTPSQHIPRIQEAQASAYHALRELIELR